MPYLEFFSIIAFGKHLQSGDVHEAFLCSYETKTSKGSDLKFYQVTFSARTSNYISVCSSPFSREKSSFDEESAWLKQQVEMLLEQLAKYGVDSVKEGRWLNEAPYGSANEKLINILPISNQAAATDAMSGA